MKNILPVLFSVFILVISFYADQNRTSMQHTKYRFPLSIVYKCGAHSDGKQIQAVPFKSTYRAKNLDSIGTFPFVDPGFVRMLDFHEQFLKKQPRKEYKIDRLSFSNTDLLKVVQIFKNYQYSFPADLGNKFDFYQIKGEDNLGNVKFSAYYTPIVKASMIKTSAYPIGVYKRPTSKDEVDVLNIRNGELENKGLAIAYVQNLQALRMLSLEGAGILEFENGQFKHIAYHDKTSSDHFSDDSKITETATDANGSSILRNTKISSYPFFIEVDKNKVSSAGTPLEPWSTIAVDGSVIPIGACLLSATPVVEEYEKLKHHALQYVLAGDTGEAIKGTGKIDYYVGAGDKAAEFASNLHHYGQLWLILPKKQKQRHHL
ncbi:MAG: 3D domain-containing protein [Saprospiraceae bacterium]